MAVAVALALTPVIVISTAFTATTIKLVNTPATINQREAESRRGRMLVATASWSQPKRCSSQSSKAPRHIHQRVLMLVLTLV